MSSRRLRPIATFAIDGIRGCRAPQIACRTNSSGQVLFEGVVAGVGIGSGVAAYSNVTVRQAWTVTAAKVDDVTGRSTLTITVNNRTGNVTVEREIRSARDGR